MTKKRIYWTDEDREVLITTGVEVMLRHPQLSMLQTFKKAQNIAINQKKLSPDKKRKINAMSAIPWFEEEVVERYKSQTEEKEPTERIVEKPIHDFSTDEIIAELCRRFTTPIIGRIAQIASAEIVEQLTHTPKKQHSAPRTRKPKIVIVGLLPEQQKLTQSKFPHLNFAFAPNHGGTNLANQAREADHVVLMTKFISHTAQERIKSKDVHIIPVHGGMNDLWKSLGEI